jgi:hypothetical protein
MSKNEKKPITEDFTPAGKKVVQACVNNNECVRTNFLFKPSSLCSKSLIDSGVTSVTSWFKSVGKTQ